MYYFNNGPMFVPLASLSGLQNYFRGITVPFLSQVKLSLISFSTRVQGIYDDIVSRFLPIPYLADSRKYPLLIIANNAWLFKQKTRSHVSGSSIIYETPFMKNQWCSTAGFSSPNTSSFPSSSISLSHFGHCFSHHALVTYPVKIAGAEPGTPIVPR